MLRASRQNSVPVRSMSRCATVGDLKREIHRRTAISMQSQLLAARNGPPLAFRGRLHGCNSSTRFPFGGLELQDAELLTSFHGPDDTARDVSSQPLLLEGAPTALDPWRPLRFASLPWFTL